MSSNTLRRKCAWIKARFDEGRTRQRPIYGMISGRVNVGLSAEDWAFVRWLAETTDCTLSDVVREAVSESRIHCAEEAFDGTPLPWARS